MREVSVTEPFCFSMGRLRGCIYPGRDSTAARPPFGGRAAQDPQKVASAVYPKKLEKARRALSQIQDGKRPT